MLISDSSKLWQGLMWIPERGTIWLSRLYGEERSTLITENQSSGLELPCGQLAAGWKCCLEVVYKCYKNRAGPKIIDYLWKLKEISIPEPGNKELETPKSAWEVLGASRREGWAPACPRSALRCSTAISKSWSATALLCRLGHQGQASRATTLKLGIFVHVWIVAALKQYADLPLQYRCILNYYPNWSRVPRNEGTLWLVNNALSDPPLAAILKCLLIEMLAITVVFSYGKKIVGLACLFLGKFRFLVCQPCKSPLNKLKTSLSTQVFFTGWVEDKQTISSVPPDLLFP